MREKFTMRDQMEPDYGNWVSTKLVYGSAAVCLPFFGLSLLYPALAVGAAPFLLSSGYFAFARHKLSQEGANLQVRIRNLIVERLNWNGDGRALDIGCGNGPLTIELAKRYPNAHVTGIDYWGSRWEYSKAVCEKNAEIEDVASRVIFQKASAAALPFEDGSFDAVVSNLVFHEVGDVKDKRQLLKEALRVVKRDGVFAFQDLFLLKNQFGTVDDLLATIRTWGVPEVAFADTSKSDFIPKALRVPFMLGRIGILFGKM